MFAKLGDSAGWCICLQQSMVVWTSLLPAAWYHAIVTPCCCLLFPLPAAAYRENMHRLGRGKRSNNKPYWTPRKTKTTTPDTSNPAAASASPNQTGRPTDPVQQPANPANVDITSSKLGFDLQLQSLQGSTSSPKSAASEASSDSAWGSATPDRGRSPGVSYSSVAKGAGAAGVAACGAISSSPVVSPAKAAGKWRRV